jgi:AP-4 complex subunit mu-1
MNFLHIKKSNLYFVVTTKYNVSPSLVLELLTRIIRLTKDFIGSLSEENIRANFLIIYELLDEVLVKQIFIIRIMDTVKQLLQMDYLITF